MNVCSEMKRGFTTKQKNTHSQSEREFIVNECIKRTRSMGDGRGFYDGNESYKYYCDDRKRRKGIMIS